MRTKLLFFLSLFFVVNNCWGQITFQKVISTPNGCSANAVQQTTDGGYIVTGYSYIHSDDTAFDYLIKTNGEGDTLWTKTFVTTYGSLAQSVHQTTDGGYIIAGTNGYGLIDEDIYVVKTDTGGDTLWTKDYSGNNDAEGSFIQQTNDSGYIITGRTLSFGPGGWDVYLIKIDANGDIIWTKTYGGSDDEWGYCVKQTSDSGYVICGYTNSFGAGNEDVYLIKTNSNGDTLWTKTYGGIGDDKGNSVQQTIDGGYIITGSTTSFGVGMKNVYLIKTDVNGDTLWIKTYGGTNSDNGLDVHQTTDSGYIITGITNSFGATLFNVYVIKTNANGDTLWTKTYGGTYGAEGFSGRQTADGGYIIAGNFFGYAVYLIKTDANGNSGCNQGSPNTIVGYTATQVGSTQTIVDFGGTASQTNTIIGSGGNDSTLCLTVGIHELSLNSTITIYPNPATDRLVVSGNWKESSNLKLTIYNILGERIYTETVNRKQSTANCSSFPSGVYFVTVANENEQWVGRFVKE